MLPVSIEGVRRNFGISSAYMYTVTLIDETGRRIFPVGAERHEALPIVAALHDLALPRPQPINVLVDTLRLHGVTLKEVRLEHSSMVPVHYIFSVTLLWHNSNTGEIEQKLDMCPGDALGLALLMHCPILLSDDLAELGITLAAGQTPELYMIGDLLKREGVTLPEGKNRAWATAKYPCARPSSKSSRLPSWAKHHLSLKKTWSSEKRPTWPFS